MDFFSEADVKSTPEPNPLLQCLEPRRIVKHENINSPEAQAEATWGEVSGTYLP